MDFLTQYEIPLIIGICLCTGYIIKKWIKDINDKYIPTFCAIIGVFLSIWIAGWKISPDIILQGMFSGLSATGLHQLFKQLVEGKIRKVKRNY